MFLPVAYQLLFNRPKIPVRFEHLSNEAISIVIDYLDFYDLLELRSLSTRFYEYGLVELASEKRLRANPDWPLVLPSRLQPSFSCSFAKYFSAASYWIDLPFTSRSIYLLIACLLFYIDPFIDC